MRYIKRNSIFALIIFLSFSCNKSFLELQSKEATDARDAIVDIESMSFAINGVYGLMQNGSYYNRSFYFIPDLISDNVYLSRNKRTYYRTIGKFTAVANNSRVTSMWKQIYRVVVNSGLIIKAGSKLKVPDGDTLEKKAMVGEAYAIRALAHFDLCRIFAQPYSFSTDASHPGIPLIMHPSIEIDNLTYPARNTVKEVYDSVIYDFKEAIKRLPEKIPGQSASYKGMITLNAAKALLSRVYLYKEDWVNAKKLATEVINSHQYSLIPTNELVSSYNQRNNSESIFEIENTFTDGSGTSSVAYYYSQKGYGDGLPSWNLYDSYSSTDVRKDFMEIGDRNSSGAEKNVPLVTKFHKMDGNFEQDVIVIRLSEMYLNRAEAEAHLTGQEGNAIKDIDTIARRADPSVVIDNSLTGQDLIDRILQERRKEFAFEGQRLFDLTRNKKSFTKYYTGGDSTIVDYPNKKTIMPIPHDEIEVNKSLDQNPGY